MKALHELKRDVVAVCRRLDERAYVAGRDGNVSVRLANGNVLITPAGVRKGDVTAEGLLLVDAEGRVLAGRGEPTTETLLHLRIFALRPDVGAVVHAHPPTATGFATAGVALNRCVLPEVIVGLGEVPVVRYASPGTEALAESLRPHLANHDAFLLENHGVVTVGADLDGAYQRLETVEHAARILLVAELLGGANALPPGQVLELLAARPRYGVREGLAGCELGECDATEASGGGHDDTALAERIAERVVKRVRGQEG